LKKLLQIFVLVFIILRVCAFSEEPRVVFQWTDDFGKIHFTTNFNSIPPAFRNSAVKGVFSPDAKPRQLKPKCENETPAVTETNYYLKSGTLHVEGKIVNGSFQSISHVMVKVNFYNSNDQFVKSESTYADPLEFAPCEKGYFSIVTPDPGNISSFKTELAWK
jgi:hypothetical protein